MKPHIPDRPKPSEPSLPPGRRPIGIKPRPTARATGDQGPPRYIDFQDWLLAKERDR